MVNTKTNRQRGSKRLQICSLVNLKLVIFSIDLDSRAIFFLMQSLTRLQLAKTMATTGHFSE